MVKSKIIIDGDIFLYQSSFTAERDLCWDASEDYWTVYGDLNKAKSIFHEQLQRAIEIVGVNNFVICFSGKDIFRLKISDTYKANRSGKRKPVLLKPLRDHCLEKYPCRIVPHLEADDLLGLLADEGDIMVSSDKDLLTVPGMHFNPSKEEKGVVQITPHEAIYNHYIQTLVGDTADNFKGCPGIGIVKAKRNLRIAPPSEMWANMLEIFAGADLNEDYALQQARLAYILRGSDYDFKTGHISFWEPTHYNEYDRTITTA